MTACKTRFLAAAAILFAASAIANAQSGPMGHSMGSDLRKAVAGNTVYLRTSGIVLPIAYHPNGTMSGRLPALAAMMATDMPATDKGKWWTAEGRLCQRWNRWLDGRSHCYRFTRDGQTVQWLRDDGKTGTARIGG